MKKRNIARLMVALLLAPQVFPQQTSEPGPQPGPQQGAARAGGEPSPQHTKGARAGDAGLTIRASTRLVQVSVIVHDRDGHPVTGLTRADFILLDKGKPQTIPVFSEVHTQSSARDAASNTAAAPRLATDAATTPAVPATFTNRPEGQVSAAKAVTVVLFDMLNTGATDSLYGKQQIVRFLRQLRPEDSVALYTLNSRGVQILHDFTSDAAPLLRALEHYGVREENQLHTSANTEAADTGLKELDQIFANTSRLEAGMAVRDRMRRTVDALAAIADHVAGVPGRKNLVWVSGSFPLAYGFDRIVPSQREMRVGGETGNTEFAQTSAQLSRGSGGRGGPQASPPRDANPDLMISPDQGFFVQDLERAARALNQAAMAIYPVDARGLMAPVPNRNFDPTLIARGLGPTIPKINEGGPDRKEFDTMNVLAERTGGRAYYNTNDIFQSVRRAVDESLVTYELGYYPANTRWDGQFHEVTVRVKRSGLEVRHRRGYFAVADAAPAGTAAEMLQTAAGAPLPSAALGLRVRLEPDAGGAMAVKMEMDAHEISLAREGDRWVGAVAVLIVQRGSDGAALASSAQSVDLRLQPATYEKLLREGVRLSKTVQLDARAEELRVLVRDATTGAVGSVFVPIAR